MARVIRERLDATGARKTFIVGSAAQKGALGARQPSQHGNPVAAIERLPRLAGEGTRAGEGDEEYSGDLHGGPSPTMVGLFTLPHSQPVPLPILTRATKRAINVVERQPELSKFMSM